MKRTQNKLLKTYKVWLRKKGGAFSICNANVEWMASFHAKAPRAWAQEASETGLPELSYYWAVSLQTPPLLPPAAMQKAAGCSRHASSISGQHRPSFPQSSPSHMPKHCLLKLALDLYRVSTSEKFFDAIIDNGLRKHLHTQGNICPLWDFAIKSNCRWLGILTSPDLKDRSSGALLRQGGQGHPLCWSALSCDLQLPSPTSSTLSSHWQWREHPLYT